MRLKSLAKLMVGAVFASALVTAPGMAANAYAPTSDVMYQLPSSEPCLKGRGNCVIYGKTAETASGRLVAAFEKATVTKYAAPDTIGGAVGGVMPIWKSDDAGDSWQPLTEVKAPAFMSSDPAVAKYTSNWGSPYLFTMPETVGAIPKGTLLLSSLVTGEDEFYRENKLRDPNWIPNQDGDRRDTAIALYKSSDNGATWSFVNIIAEGGWQGGSAGAGGVNIAAANKTRQQDPVWEPHIIVYDGKLVTYYSDENDYASYNTQTGAPALKSNNAGGRDSGAQILVHKTWDGTSATWSSPVVDVAGDTFTFDGATQIGGGRPGMTTVAKMTDGKWMMTFEYFGGGANVRYKISDNPLRFFADNDPNGEEITRLPVDQGSRRLSTGGSPVLITLPDGRIAFNAAGSGSIWISDGASNDAWTEQQTTVGAGYTRTLQPVSSTGRVLIMQSQWLGASEQPSIRVAGVDFGFSKGEYYRLVNKKTGQVIGTGNNINDANLGNGNQPDVQLEPAGAAANNATQLWHLTPKPNGTTALLNKAGGRAAGIWTANATAGQRIGQWVDDTSAGIWRVINNPDGSVRFQSTANTALFLSGTSAGGALTLQSSAGDGSQDWQLVAESSGTVRLQNGSSTKCADVWNNQVSNQSPVNQFGCGTGINQRWTIEEAGSNVRLVSALSGKCLEIGSFSTTPGAVATQYTCNDGTNQLWTRTSVAGGATTFRNVNSGQCLEIFSNSAADGAKLTQWPCNGGRHQSWIVG